ncbi:MAG: DUF86 domain-containing protein [Nanoarchaeota archaeon]|nr:DUF86 domain-containing protein [Nanoarchaeota archaeon]
MLRDNLNRMISFIKDNMNMLEIIIKKYEKAASQEKEILLAAMERKAEECVESAIKINQHILEERGKIADSYYSSFIDLNILKIFDEKLLSNLAKTAGFRNRLAHEYMDLSEEVTVKTIRKILKLYPKYLLKIADYVNK